LREKASTAQANATAISGVIGSVDASTIFDFLTLFRVAFTLPGLAMPSRISARRSTMATCSVSAEINVKHVTVNADQAVSIITVGFYD
jgi:hypothetical protein